MSEKLAKEAKLRREQSRRSRDLLLTHLLLRIIAANPRTDKKLTDWSLLASAREALLGEKRPRGRAPVDEWRLLYLVEMERRKPELDHMRQWMAKQTQGQTADALLVEVGRPQVSANQVVGQHFDDVHSHSNRQRDSEQDRFRRKSRPIPTDKDMAVMEGIFNCNSPEAEVIELLLSRLHLLTPFPEEPT
jgi:hypothetical protein